MRGSAPDPAPQTPARLDLPGPTRRSQRACCRQGRSPSVRPAIEDMPAGRARQSRAGGRLKARARCGAPPRTPRPQPRRGWIRPGGAVVDRAGDVLSGDQSPGGPVPNRWWREGSRAAATATDRTGRPGTLPMRDRPAPEGDPWRRAAPCSLVRPAHVRTAHVRPVRVRTVRLRPALGRSEHSPAHPGPGPPRGPVGDARGARPRRGHDVRTPRRTRPSPAPPRRTALPASCRCRNASPGPRSRRCVPPARDGRSRRWS